MVSTMEGIRNNWASQHPEVCADKIVSQMETIEALRAERDALAAQLARQLDRLRQIESLTCPAGGDYGNSEVCAIARSGIAEEAPAALDAIKREAAAEELERLAKEDCQTVFYESFRYVRRQHLLARAAELRAGGGKVVG